MESFRIVFLDDDKKTFGISLPMFNDEKVTHKTSELQKSGKNVRVCTATATPYEIQTYYEQLGYTYDMYLNW